MNNVPFIVGQSTAPSHNVKSNVQNVRKKKRFFFKINKNHFSDNLGYCFIKKS